MIKRIKEIFKARKTKKEQLKEHLKMKNYYELLQKGAMVLQYIHNDMEQQKKKMNRAERRRFETSLKHDGKFSAEIVMKYVSHFPKMTEYINNELAKTIKIKETKIQETIRLLQEENAKLIKVINEK